MQIQVNSDQSVAVDAGLAAFVEETVRRVLTRWTNDVSRVEIHLSDVNGERFGTMDKRCLLEARPAGGDPVAVTAEGGAVEAAVRAAAQKMDRLLDSRFGKLRANR